MQQSSPDRATAAKGEADVRRIIKHLRGQVRLAAQPA